MQPVRYVFQLYTFAGEDLYWWRFMSSNGRFLARCPEPHASAVEARAAITATVAALGSVAVVVRPTPENRWRWSMRLAGEVVALGHGDQDRRVRCDAAAQRFAEMAAAAPVDASVHVFRRREAPRRAERAAR